MIENRPEFDKITSFDEFNKYYWYRDKLSQICKSLGLEYRGTKQELNDIIEQSFLTVKVKLKTSEGSSNSITASIVNDNGTQKLIYTYLNNPRAELQSPIHYVVNCIFIFFYKKQRSNQS